MGEHSSSREHTHCGRRHTADNTRTADVLCITGGTHAQRAIASGLDAAGLSVVMSLVLLSRMYVCLFVRRAQLRGKIRIAPHTAAAVVLETQDADRHRTTSSVCSIVVSQSVTVVLGMGAVCGESIVAMLCAVWSFRLVVRPDSGKTNQLKTNDRIHSTPP